MINIQTIQNVSDCVPLYLPHSLYLKPLAKLHISVALPQNKTGKNISNLDIMEKLSSALKPDKFLVLKVSKSTVDFIRFEAELDERARLRSAIGRLDGASLRISGFSESFRVRCSEPKDEFPTRYDWDSFFRDANHMDEMKAGERPDTIHLTHLPIRWFCPRASENDENVKPSESIFKRIFEKFGCVRCVDIPICDPYRSKMNSDINGMKVFSFEQDVLFEAYVQFDEYVGFVRAMDEFRGMKLVRKFMDKTQAINIVVNFDKTKHLSDAQIQRRERVRNRLLQKAKHEEEEKELAKKRKLAELEQQRKKEEQEKLAELERKREREERRKEKHLKKIQEKGQVEISQKIRVEERKLMIAQRKLESIRILEELFDRLNTRHAEKHGKSKENDLENMKRVQLVNKYKVATEQLVNEQKKKVQQIKTKTPITGLLKGIGNEGDSSSEEDDGPESAAAQVKRQAVAVPPPGLLPTPDTMPMNPFKAAAAFAVAGGNPAVVHPAAAAAAHNADGSAAAYSNEWMKSFSMFPYVPPVFPGMPPMYRPPFPVSANYRGFAPRMIRPRGRGRGRGRGGMPYDPHAGNNSSYYNNYKHYKYDDEEQDEELTDERNGGGGGGSGPGRGSYYHKSSHYSSRSRNRSRSRSRSRSHSRSRYRSSRHYSKRSRSRSRRSSSRSSRSHSKSPTSHRTNRKLASTRRSRSPSDSSDRSHTRSRSSSRHSRHSRSRSRSRTQSRDRTRARSRSRGRTSRSKRSSSKRDAGEVTGNGSGSTSRRERSSSRHRQHSASPPRRAAIVLEADKLVRSAEEIKRSVAKDLKQQQQIEEHQISRHRSKHSPIIAASSTNGRDSQPKRVRRDRSDAAEDDEYDDDDDGDNERRHPTAADSSLAAADEYERRHHHKSDKHYRSSSRQRSRRNSSDREAAAY